MNEQKSLCERCRLAVARRSPVATVVLVMCMAASLTACSDDPSTPARVQTAAQEFAFVTTTDFQTGSSSVIWMDGKYSTDVNVAAIHSDAVAQFVDGYVYVVNRLGGDNIQILDPANGFSTVRQFSVGNGSDPHDIAVVGPSKAYVSRYNETTLLIVNPATGAETGVVDLGALADGDGKPEMDHLAVVGSRLFVTVQRIDRGGNWNPVGDSYVVVIDTNTDQMLDTDAPTSGVQPLALAGTNPFSDALRHPTSGALYMACVGDWGVADGGIEVIDPVSLTSLGMVFAGATAGGDITDAVIMSDDKGYAIVTGSNFHTSLVAFNPTTGALLGTVYAPGDFTLQDVELSPGGELFVTDRSPTKPGIRIFDTATDMPTVTDPIDTGLPPFAITFGTVD